MSVTDVLLTMASDGDEPAPVIGTLQAANAAFLRDHMRTSEHFAIGDITHVLPLIVAYGLMDGRLPNGLGDGDGKRIALRAGAIVCHAAWRDCQANAYVSVGGRLVVAVPRIYTQGPLGSTYAVPNPSRFTHRRIVRFASWAVGLLAERHQQAWMEATMIDGGDPVAGAAIAIASQRASGSPA
jgi:hypothetical protein